MEISLREWIATQRQNLHDSAVLMRLVQERSEENGRNLDRLEEAFERVEKDPVYVPVPDSWGREKAVHKGGWPKGKSRKPKPTPDAPVSAG